MTRLKRIVQPEKCETTATMACVSYLGTKSTVSSQRGNTRSHGHKGSMLVYLREGKKVQTVGVRWSLLGRTCAMACSILEETVEASMATTPGSSSGWSLRQQHHIQWANRTPISFPLKVRQTPAQDGNRRQVLYSKLLMLMLLT